MACCFWLLIAGVSYISKTQLHLVLMGNCLLISGSVVAIGVGAIAICSAFAATGILRHGNTIQALEAGLQ